MKKLVSLLLVLALVFGAFAPAFAVDNSADVLQKAGILTGDASGDLMLDKQLNRQDMIVLLSRLLGKESTAKNYPFAPSFTDVTNDFYAPYIAWAEGEGLTTGIGANKFGFGDELTVKQLQAFLLRAMGKTVAWEEVTIEANKAGLESDATSATRQVMADLTLAALKAEGGKLAANLGVEVGAIGSVVTAAVRNNTTVEVTFAQDMTGAQAADFTVSEDLAVENAAVKQSNNKVVILTTAKQTADTEYTISYNGQEVATFKGVAPVAVSKVELMNKANDYVVQTQNVVTAKVTPANADDSKEGIEVTLNVVNADNGSALFPTVIKTAVTNAEGIATFEGYTRYAAGKDVITVYPTGSAHVRDTGVAFWALKDLLTVTPDAEQTVNNSAVQNYTITLNTTGGAAAYNVPVAIALKDTTGMVDVKVPTTGKVAKNPSTTNPLVANTNANGQIIFTVTGVNTTATPVVWVDSNAVSVDSVYRGTPNGELDSTELQAVAGKVVFNAIQAPYVMEVDKTEAFDAMINKTANYTVTVKKADGTPYVDGYVSARFVEDFDSDMYTNSTNVKFATGTYGDATQKTTVMKLDSNGQATFKSTSTVAWASATPEFWINLNNVGYKTVGALEIGEPTVKAVKATFKSEKLNNYKFAANNGANPLMASNESETYEFSLINQAGTTLNTTLGTIDRVDFTIRNTGNYTVNITPASSDAANFVLNAPGTTYTIHPGETRTIWGKTKAYSSLTNTVNRALAINKVGITIPAAVAEQKVSVTATANGFNFVGTANVPVYYVASTPVDSEWVYVSSPVSQTATTDVYVGEVVRNSTSGEWLIVKRDGNAGYVKLTYDRTEVFAVGSYADFASLNGSTWQYFETTISKGDRVQYKGNPITTAREIRLINVDGSASGTPTEVDAFVDVNGNGNLSVTSQILKANQTYGPSATKTRATLANGAVIKLGDYATDKVNTNFTMKLRNVDVVAGGTATVVVDAGPYGNVTLENLNSTGTGTLNVMVLSGGINSVHFTGSTRINNLNISNSTPVRVVLENTANVTATTVSTANTTVFEDTSTSNFGTVNVSMAGANVTIPDGAYSTLSANAGANVNGVGLTNTAYLSGLNKTAGTFTASFAESTLAYTLNLTAGTNSTTVTGVGIAGANQTIVYSLDGAADVSTAPAIAMTDGQTRTLKVKVTSQDLTNTKEYVVTVTQALAAANNLATLNVAGNALNVAAPADGKHTVAAANNATSIPVVATNVAGETILVNGTPVNSGQTFNVPFITEQTKEIVIINRKAGASDKTYTITVNRTPVAADVTAPKTTGVVTTTTPAGSYKAGQHVNLVVTFDENVVVTNGGNIKLDLDTTSHASFVSASGNTIQFDLLIAAGDTSAALKPDDPAILLNGGTIKDAAGNAVDVATGQDCDTIEGNAMATTIKVDTAAPTAAVTTATVSKAAADVTTAQSSELGTAYLVAVGTAVTDKASLEALVTAGTAAKATIGTINTNTQITVQGTTLVAGGQTYNVYAVDAAGNVSAASTGVITLND